MYRDWETGITVIIAEHRLERVIGYVDTIIEIGSDGLTRIGKPEEILRNSKIAPPIVKLARALKLPEISLSVRDLRKKTEDLRNQGRDLVKTESGIGKTFVETKALSVSYDQKMANQSNKSK